MFGCLGMFLLHVFRDYTWEHVGRAFGILVFMGMSMGFFWPRCYEHCQFAQHVDVAGSSSVQTEPLIPSHVTRSWQITPIYKIYLCTMR